MPAIQEVASYIGQRAEAGDCGVWRCGGPRSNPHCLLLPREFRAVQPAISATAPSLISLGKAVFKVAAWILSKLLPPLGRLAGWILSKVIPAVAWLVTAGDPSWAPSPSSGRH